jgi:hypothetical protein
VTPTTADWQALQAAIAGDVILPDAPDLPHRSGAEGYCLPADLAARSRARPDRGLAGLGTQRT